MGVSPESIRALVKLGLVIKLCLNRQGKKVRYILGGAMFGKIE